MDNFEINKIIASVLIALIVGMGATLLSESLIRPEKLLKNIYIIEIPEGAGEKGASPGAGVEKAEEPIEVLLGKAHRESGEKISKRCLQCHSLEKGGPNKIGPNLWGIVGGPTAHRPDYAYSKALLEKKGQWDFKTLNDFLHKPNAVIKGTKMSFAGLTKAQERADLIAYLCTLSDTPVPLPGK